ncbi:thioesterase [Corynebacterium liangguodongii]|uniref:Thioesterase n=2 Tax=Corynebacterium liangguodongii TaxID=2079535 RepID=A0A2S0WDY3_9CORY|nr:PaaI family thioesterase [Corynebacterium liangguodongii]AWB83987.1 thioesterase [Corynebacterium liangguodongii]PWB99998.1 PaaI family thioesterase [Corynebacterium liangguodongii]
MDHRFGGKKLERPLDDAELAAFNASTRGLARTLGITLTFISGERAEGYVDVEERHHQVTGIANGGLYCAIGETLGSVAGAAASGHTVVGMNNNTDLLGSVDAGRIDAVALPVHVGRSTHLWRVEMWHEARLVATTNLRLMVLAERRVGS